MINDSRHSVIHDKKYYPRNYDPSTAPAFYFVMLASVSHQVIVILNLVNPWFLFKERWAALSNSWRVELKRRFLTIKPQRVVTIRCQESIGRNYEG
jgi:hypothetical protein